MASPIADKDKSVLAVSILFRPTNQVLDYRAMEEFSGLRVGEAVIAETRFGPQVGWVRKAPFLGPPSALTTYRLLGRATSTEVQRFYRLREKAKKDMAFVQKKVYDHGLPMRLLDAEYPLDENQFVVYFVAEGRVDFRGLVHDLKQSFPRRVMLFQIGPRDAIRMVGALGPCGRPTCCSTFLRSFESVTMRMAKEQLLDLNPSRLMGICGKLKCCLRFEHDFYRRLLAHFPKIGQTIDTPQGRGKVIELNVLLLQVTVALENGGYRTWSLDELVSYKDFPPFPSCPGDYGGCLKKGGCQKSCPFNGVPSHEKP